MTDIINCTICLEQIVPPCCTFNTECKHIFHIKCYIRWDFKRNTCPLCRSKIRPWINNTNFNDIKIGNFIYDFNQIGDISINRETVERHSSHAKPSTG